MVGSNISHKEKTMEKRWLVGTYVAMGRITNGCIRLLDLSVPETNEQNVGLQCYGEKLLGFGKKRYVAKIVSGELQVLNQKGDVLESLSPEDLHTVDQALSRRFKVMAGGWLFHIWNRWEKIALKQIRRVEKGKEPLHHDNSPFFKVDPKHRRRIVTLYRLFSQVPDDAVVIDSKRNILQHQVKYPLAF
jgi:hypothetical protein